MSSTASKLMRSSSLRVLNLIVNIGISFFMIPFTIGHIGDRWYGLWIFVGTLIGYYGLLDIGLSTAIQRFISRALGSDDYDEINGVFNTCLVLFGCAGILSGIVSVVGALLGSHFIHSPADLEIFRVVMLICGLSMVVSFPMRAFEGLLNANIRHDIAMTIAIVEMTVRSLITVHFLRQGHGIVALAVITLVTGLIANAVTVLYVKRRFPYLKFSLSFFRRERIRSLFDYSIFSFISNIANQLRFQIDSIVITAFLGLSFVTHYSIGSRISLYYLNMVINAVAHTMPVFSTLEGRKDHEGIREKFLLLSKLNVILSTFIVGSLLIYGRAFIIRWMGPDYLDSYAVLLILVAGSYFATAQVTSVSVIFSLSKHKRYSLLLLGEGLANLALSIVLVKRYGINGVALGTTIPMIVMYLIIVPVYVCRAIDLPVGRYAGVAIRALLVGCVTHVASWLAVRSFVLEDYRRILILGALTTIAYVAVNGFALLDKSERGYFRIPF